MALLQYLLQMQQQNDIEKYENKNKLKKVLKMIIFVTNLLVPGKHSMSMETVLKEYNTWFLWFINNVINSSKNNLCKML